MRAYLLVILIILVMMGGYLALLPYGAVSDAHTSLLSAGSG